MPHSIPIVIIAGPTASGKSTLALEVAEGCRGSIVNADSMQVYAEPRVLTARPGDDETARVPHHLYGCLSVHERCSVGRWLEMAVAAVNDTRAEGRTPVCVGGTGLYLKALMEGLAPVPDVPDALTRDMDRQYDELGGEAFRARLRAVDPQAAEKLPATDRQRLVRAYAVAEATGRPLGEWQRQQTSAPPVQGDFHVVALMPPRDALYTAIEARFDAMMAAGALEEARYLSGLNMAPDLPAAKAVGVAELSAFLAGNGTLEEAVAAAKQASRNYAKRQLTWLRNQLQADHTIDFLVDGTWSKRAAKVILKGLNETK